jgi:U3 small nucleolar RNA-associated protein 10
MLSVMVSSVPTFIAAQQLQDLAQLGLKSRDVDGSDAHALVSAIAKRVPTKTLLPVIFDVWKKAKAGKERVSYQGGTGVRS